MTLVRFHPAAGEEAEEASTWYFSERPALGLDFERELNAAIKLLREKPIPSTIHPVAGRLEAKRIFLERFPYDLVFVERNDTIVVLAVAHQSRRPGYWKRR